MVKNILKKLSGNSFLAIGIFSAFSALVRILSTLCIGKLIATLLGPQGLALIGQLTNFTLIILVFAGTSITQGVTKYVSEYNKSNPEGLPALISTAFSYYIISSAICCILLLIFAPVFAGWFLLNTDYSYIFWLFALSLIFISLNNFLLSILNGFKQFKLFNALNIWGNLINLGISALLMYRFGIMGALVGVFAGQAISFFVTLIALKKYEWLTLHNFRLKPDRPMLKNLAKFALLAVMSTALYPLVTIIVRSIIIDRISLGAAGIYEFLMRVSSATLLFFSIAISTYYIPRLSEITTVEELKKEVWGAYKIATPIAFILLGGLYLFRNVAISILADDKFSGASNLFLFQLMGDFFKINAQILSFILVARAKIKPAIIIEIGFNLLYLALLSVAVGFFNLKGAPVAYAVAYLVYFIIFVLYYKFKIVKHFYDS